MNFITRIIFIFFTAIFGISCQNGNPLDPSRQDETRYVTFENEPGSDIYLHKSLKSKPLTDEENGMTPAELRSGINPKNGYTSTDDSTDVSINP